MMAFPRRFLPAIAHLTAFEAAARLESFTEAAEELNLTQSAVSRQIRALEETLGATLFQRERKTVRLTHGGEVYAREIRAALNKIAAASLGFRASPLGGSLNLGILPTFGARWLAPRLPQFLDNNPGVTVNLTTRITPFDFILEGLDAAIHFGATDWPGAGVDLLMGETVVPACSPAFLERHPISGPQDLLELPLLHLSSRPDAWERWFEGRGVQIGPIHGMLIDQFATAAQAAASGLGLALLPEFLIRSELERGELVQAVDGRVESRECYFLAWPLDRAGYAPLEAFRAWLKAETEQAQKS
jgi:LysR family glycine cleavage system transcriptional activator